MQIYKLNRTDLEPVEIKGSLLGYGEAPGCAVQLFETEHSFVFAVASLNTLPPIEKVVFVDTPADLALLVAAWSAPSSSYPQAAAQALTQAGLMEFLAQALMEEYDEQLKTIVDLHKDLTQSL